MIQVRNVPLSLHRELTRRAAARGLTLTGYVQEILEREVSRPTREEFLERIRSRPPVELDVPVAELLAQERPLE